MKRWLVMGVALLLAACAKDLGRWTPQPDEKIGLSAGDSARMMTGRISHRARLFGGGLNGRPVALASVVRAQEVSGKTRICAALVVVGDYPVIDEVKAGLARSEIQVFLGREGRPYDFNESLPSQHLRLHVYGKPFGEATLDLKSLLPIDANCVLTELAWNPAYRDGHRLVVPR